MIFLATSGWHLGWTCDWLSAHPLTFRLNEVIIIQQWTNSLGQSFECLTKCSAGGNCPSSRMPGASIETRIRWSFVQLAKPVTGLVYRCTFYVSPMTPPKRVLLGKINILGILGNWKTCLWFTSYLCKSQQIKSNLANKKNLKSMLRYRVNK